MEITEIKKSLFSYVRGLIQYQRGMKEDPKIISDIAYKTFLELTNFIIYAEHDGSSEVASEQIDKEQMDMVKEFGEYLDELEGNAKKDKEAKA